MSVCVCGRQAACAHIKPHKKVVNSIVIWQTKHRKWAEPRRAKLSCLCLCLRRCPRPAYRPPTCTPGVCLCALCALPRFLIFLCSRSLSQLCGLKRCLVLKTKHFFVVVVCDFVCVCVFVCECFLHIFCFIARLVSLFSARLPA